ncbi:hypothetical protein [Marinobacterium jannaschii]|uniref:hypothetical protein n=1 Tax=Marinobacterium jannaschii TaxID=64970 RepID=UPI0004854124|nr:hypothetical protein [Marinobacterium jannaschii]
MNERQIETAAYHGPDRRAGGEWHVDKTVSISHLLTTLALVIAAFWFFAEQDKKIAENAKDIQHNSAAIQQQESRVNRSLDAINSKLDKLIDQMIRGN